MDPQSFRTICAYHQATWLSDQLKLTPANGQGGIDAADDKIAIEMKNRLRDWYHSWPIHAYQITKFPRENRGKEMFWAFLLYDLTKTVPSIRNRDLPGAILNREVWMMPWKWVKKFPVHRPKTGPYVYVHHKDLPDRNYFSRFQRSHGALYVPKDSSLEERL